MGRELAPLVAEDADWVWVWEVLPLLLLEFMFWTNPVLCSGEIVWVLEEVVWAAVWAVDWAVVVAVVSLELLFEEEEEEEEAEDEDEAEDEEEEEDELDVDEDEEEDEEEDLPLSGSRPEPLLEYKIDSSSVMAMSSLI